MRPETLLRLARRRGIDLPADSTAGLREWFRFQGFEHFLDIYVLCSRCLREPEDFQVLVDEFMEEQSRQRVLYTEAHFTISTHAAHGANTDEVAHAMWEAISEGERRHGVSLRLIPDIVRNLGPDRGEVTLDWALENRERGVVAMGLAGIEAYPAEPFAGLFDEAHDQDLPVVAHAGEQQDSSSMQTTVEITRPRRIGHGIAAVQDPGLLAELADNGVPVEVCPSSNVCLGFAESISAHPFDQLRRAGVAVTVNSDDPPLFDTTLSREYRLVAEAFGYSREELICLARTAATQTLLDGGEQDRLLARFDREVGALEEEQSRRA